MNDRALQSLYVFQAFPEDGGHVFVTDGIENVLAILAELHETAVAKNTELMGNGRVGEFKTGCDIPDTQFLAHEGHEDSDPCEVSKDTESLGEIVLDRIDVFPLHDFFQLVAAFT
jgi:hypothetical protein